MTEHTMYFTKRVQFPVRVLDCIWSAGHWHLIQSRRGTVSITIYGISLSIVFVFCALTDVQIKDVRLAFAFVGVCFFTSSMQ